MKKKLALTLVLLIVCGICGYANTDLENAVFKTSDYVYQTVQNPTVSSIGGEWAVIGLSGSGKDFPIEYYEKYCRNLKEYLNTNNGILSERKYTEYSRVIIALTAIGKDPSNIYGYNLLEPLGNFNATVKQGINGAIWALIALDCGAYEMPKNDVAPIQASREMYVNYILSKQNADGGWAMGNQPVSDPDITAMAISAISEYAKEDKVNLALDRALMFVSEYLKANPTIESSETIAQIVTALCAADVSLDDIGFMTDGVNLVNKMLEFAEADGSFCHIKGNGSNMMATEQCLYAMDAVIKYNKTKTSFWNMRDIKKTDNNDREKDKDKEYSANNFVDISECAEKRQIELLASRGIITGKSSKIYDPYATMTRAEFAALIVRAFNLTGMCESTFVDVTSGDWFYDSVMIAYKNGIITGVSDTEFNPGGAVTKEEAAVMLMRAAKLCKMDTSIDNATDILSEFYDYKSINDWAVSAMAFCVKMNIINCEEIEIKPQIAVNRAEIAFMVCNMLNIAELL